MTILGGAQFCQDALELLPRSPSSQRMLTIHVHILVMLGDAMEGQGDWARARQYDKQALAMWEHTEVRSRSWGTVLSARRRDGLELIREGNFAAARRKLAFVERYYADAIEQAGINFNHLIDLSAAMTTLKVWPKRACLLHQQTAML